MSPAHRSPERRWRCSPSWSGRGGSGHRRPAPGARRPRRARRRRPRALVGAPDAESTAWYCTGQSTGSGVAPGFVVLTNTTARTVDGIVTTVTDSDAVVHTAVSVPARGATAPAIPTLSSGSWEGETVTVAGGGVAVTQVVHGASGWSQAPCQSTTAADWYFPGGTTANCGPALRLAAQPHVDARRGRPQLHHPGGLGASHQLPGDRAAAGQVEVENVASEVQNASTVSTVVATRTGRVVAAEVQGFSGTSSGLALVPGAAQPEPHWCIPQSEDVDGGRRRSTSSTPATAPESVTVHLRLASGPLAPLSDTVAPDTTWALATGSADADPSRGHVLRRHRRHRRPGRGRRADRRDARVVDGAPGRHGDGRGRGEHRVADR